MSKKALASLLTLCLLLILVNFGFDWNRRLDLNSEQQNVAKLLSQVEQTLKSNQQRSLEADILLASLQQRIEEQQNVFTQIKALISAIQRDSKPNVGSQGEQNPISDEGLKVPVSKIFETSLEEILRKRQSAVPHSYEDDYADRLVDPRYWKPGFEMAQEFEGYYGKTLSREDRIRLGLTLDSYKNLCSSAQSIYAASFDQEQIDRLEKGDYIALNSGTPGPDGLIEHKTEKQEEVFAITSRAHYLMEFRKEAQPDLYRKSLIPRYITGLLMDEVKSYFK